MTSVNSDLVGGTHATDQIAGRPDASVAEPDPPVLVYCDGATGERVALSASELAGWAARVAVLLRDECGLGPGTTAAVLLPPHWQTAAVLLGAWSAGVAVSFRPAATAGLAQPDGDVPCDVVFVSAARCDNWLEDVPDSPHRFVLGLDADAAPMRTVPDGYRDLIAALADHPGDPQASPAQVRPSDPASPDGTRFDEWGALGAELAKGWDLWAGDRLLVDADAHEQPVMWLLAPLSVGARVVLCAHHDAAALAERAVAEQTTRTL